MKFPKSARYDKTMNLVHLFFVRENITEFPIDPFEIIKRNKWGLITYSELARTHNCTIERVIKAYQSVDGYTIFDGEGYSIAYNDTVGNLGRIRFTLMHEIGHIYLNHLVDFEETVLRRSTLTQSKYEILEKEANCFARNVLAPAPIINKLKLKRDTDLVYYFQISQTAAQTRLQLLKWDSIRAFKFSLFLAIRFKNYFYNVLNSKYCLRCGHHFVSEDAKYCPICGHKKLFSKGEKRMIYDGYILDEEGYPLRCPRCENEQIGGGEYCKICGTHIINKCTNKEINRLGFVEWECGTLADGNARYCVKCGHPTTYLKNGLLEPWTNKHNVKLNLQINDDDLPF
jgi:Zn-dependent peptidase ImmA (M78 family)